MIKVTKLDSRSSELQIKFSLVGTTATATFYNVYGVEVAQLPLFKHENGKGLFRLTDDIHRLPFGRYYVNIASGNCICGCFPVQIDKCSVGDVDVAPVVNELECKDRPLRDCAPQPCAEQQCCDQCCCDECTGCSEINPCDKCHPCYDDRKQFEQYSDTAKEALGL